MKKVGIFGGSFDPVHFGHIHLAVWLKEQASLDEIWFCPDYQSPFKESAPAEAKHRLFMLRLATKEIPGFTVVDLSLHHAGPSFTIDLLQQLREQNPHIRFYLLIGDDLLARLHEWKEIDRIVKEFPLLVARRACSPPKCQGSSLLQEAVDKGIFPSFPLIQIEATEVRKRIKKNTYCGHLVPQKVLDYIYQNQLYFYDASTDR